MGSVSSNMCMPKKSKFELQCFAKHNGPINCMAMDECEEILVTGSDDATTRLWAIQTNPVECLGVIAGHEKYVTCVEVQSNCLFTGSADCTIRKWDLRTCECIDIFKGHTNRVNKLLCIDKFLFSSSYDMRALAWRIEAKQGHHSCVRIFRGHKRAVFSLAFAPANSETQQPDMLITGSQDSTARSWNIANGDNIMVFKGHRGPIQCLCVNEEGTKLFTGSSDWSIRSWDLKTGNTLHIFEGHKSGIVGLVVQSKMLYSAGGDKIGQSYVIDFGTASQVYRGHKHTLTTIIYQDGFVFTGCGDGAIRCFDAKSGELKRIYKGHTYGVTALKIGGGVLFSSSVDGNLRVWSLEGISDDTGQEMSANQSSKSKRAPKNLARGVEKNFVPRNPVSGAFELVLHGKNVQLMLDNPHPYRDVWYGVNKQEEKESREN